jgi:hypothetical protein
VHDPGKIVVDLAVAVALGGDCLAGAGVLRAGPALSGPVASDPVISRLVTRAGRGRARSAERHRQARARAHERAWQLAGSQAPGPDSGLIPVGAHAGALVVAETGDELCPGEAGRGRRRFRSSPAR